MNLSDLLKQQREVQQAPQPQMPPQAPPQYGQFQPPQYGHQQVSPQYQASPQYGQYQASPQYGQFQPPQTAPQASPQYGQSQPPQMVPDPGLFARIANSTPSESGVYLNPGLYQCLYVDKVQVIKARKGYDLFIVEFDIILSSVADRPAGTRASWAANLMQDAGPGNVKKCLAAICGCSPDEVTSELAQNVCGPQNPLHGRLVKAEATMTTTKLGKPFTLVKWFAIPEDDQAQSEQIRAQVFGR